MSSVFHSKKILWWIWILLPFKVIVRSNQIFAKHSRMTLSVASLSVAVLVNTENCKLHYVACLQSSSEGSICWQGTEELSVCLDIRHGIVWMYWVWEMWSKNYISF